MIETPPSGGVFVIGGLVNRTRIKLLAVVFIVSCGASEESVEADWNAFLSQNQSCEADTDCVVVYPGCPLGCYAAVSASSEAAANAEADRLIAKYERGGRACAYGCVEAGEPVCSAGMCTLSESPTPNSSLNNTSSTNNGTNGTTATNGTTGP